MLNVKVNSTITFNLYAAGIQQMRIGSDRNPIRKSSINYQIWIRLCIWNPKTKTKDSETSIKTQLGYNRTPHFFQWHSMANLLHESLVLILLLCFFFVSISNRSTWWKLTIIWTAIRGMWPWMSIKSLYLSIGFINGKIRVL